MNKMSKNKSFVCPKCGENDSYNTIAGKVCWKCDELLKEKE